MKSGSLLAGALLAGAGVTALWWGLTPRARSSARVRGRIECPARPRADTSGLREGDFVAITLRGAKVSAATWAVVITAGVPDVRARLVGEFGPVGVRALPAKLGFRLGDILTFSRECIFETYRPSSTGVVLCGQWLRDVSGRGPVSSSTAAPGDDVQIWLAPADPKNPQQPGPGFDVPDPVWAKIESVSVAGHVLRVRVLDAPTNTAGHGVVAGAEFDITRECIADRR